VTAVDEDNNSDEEDDDDEVAAFIQNGKNKKFQGKPKQSTSTAPQRSNQYQANTGNNSNRTGKYCFSRITLKKNAGEESGKINCAKTNKDAPTGLKCT
jgi:hypothetical protein